VQKLFKVENYSREETIHGNMVIPEKQTKIYAYLIHQSSFVASKISSYRCRRLSTWGDIPVLG
jgi:hypothetical protein